VGELVISLDELPDVRVPLVTDAAVAEGGFDQRLAVAADALWQKIRGLRTSGDPS